LKLANGSVYHQNWREEQFDEEDRGLNNAHTTSVQVLEPPAKRQRLT